MLTAGVASADDKGRALLQACLQQTGLVESVVEWRLANTEQSQVSAESVPDVVVVELARETAAALAFAAHLHRLRPSVTIIACSASQQPNPDLLMRAMRSGVGEFLHQPIDPMAVRETLERLIKEHGLAQAAERKLIVILGCKGGVGTTTVAVNLGVQMAQLSRKRIALLDFGRPLGLAWLMLGLQPRFSIRDAIEDLDRLDGHFLGGLLTAHKSGLQFLAGTSHPDAWERISVPALARLINVTQSISDLVIADLGSTYSSEWAPILGRARMVGLITEADVPSLWTLERHLSAMTSLGLEPDRLRVIVNRWHRIDDEALKVFEKKINRPVFARLPNDFRQVSEAANLGNPLSRNHNDSLVTKYRELAMQFAGLPLKETEKRGSLFDLFSTVKR